jgi:NADH-quinone oxidoreductase subunit M
MLTLLLILIPILSALALLLMNKSSFKVLRSFALIFSLLELLVFLYTFLISSNNNSVLEYKASWITQLNINFHLKPDGIGLLLMGLTIVLIPLVLLSTFKIAYKNLNVLFALIFLVNATLVGVFAAQDIFLFYFFFEAALIPVYFIALKWGGENISKVSFKMFVYTIFGSLFMLVAFVALYIKGQSSDISLLHETAKLLPVSTNYFLFWAFFLAFAIKMPVFPFHTWQPDAYTESPTPATQLLSGLLSKMGVFGLIRILIPLAPLGLAQYANIGILLALIGLIYGALIATQQNNIKRLIAYSSFSHMGLMAAGVLVNNEAGIQGAVLQMLAHGINAVGLFFIVKVIYDRTNSRELSALGGISQKAPKLCVLFVIIMLGSVALPLTNGFVGEFLLLKGIFDYNPWYGGVAGLTIIFGAVYMLRLMQKTMFGPSNSETANFEDLNGTELAVLVPIAVLVLLMGIFPNYFLKIAEPAVQLFLAN